MIFPEVPAHDSFTEHQNPSIEVVVVLGGPGSGKGTHGQALADALDYQHFSSGEHSHSPAEAAASPRRGILRKRTTRPGCTGDRTGGARCSATALTASGFVAIFRAADGVVPYWSSHLEGARSELIVLSGHNAHRNPQAIAEVRRILKLDLRENQ